MSLDHPKHQSRVRTTTYTYSRHLILETLHEFVNRHHHRHEHCKRNAFAPGAYRNRIYNVGRHHGEKFHTIRNPSHPRQPLAPSTPSSPRDCTPSIKTHTLSRALFDVELCHRDRARARARTAPLRRAAGLQRRTYHRVRLARRGSSTEHAVYCKARPRVSARARARAGKWEEEESSPDVS